MKQLSAGTSIAWRRMCKGDDLVDGVLMPKLSLLSDAVLNGRLELLGSEKENFQYGSWTKY